MPYLTHESSDFPFKFGYGEFSIPNMENLSIIHDIAKNIKQIEQKDNFQKIEIKSPREHFDLQPLFDFVEGEDTKQLAMRFSDDNSIILDSSYDGGGLTFTPSGGFLRYHHDFPYSNSVKMYRVLNLILYLSTPDIEGGDLHLIDPLSKTVEWSVSPMCFRYVIFPTSKHTPHGFNRVRNGTRISFNCYFYAEKPLDDRFSPTKTEWL